MATIKATNDWVFIEQDKKTTESHGFTLPDASKEKPSAGIIVSIGRLVKDPDIKAGKGKRALFHKGTGFSINFEGKDYLVIQSGNIIGVS